MRADGGTHPAIPSIGSVAALIAILGATAAGPLPVGPVPLAAQEGEVDAQELYDQWCAGCHGVEGDGQGPAAEWMLPRPRDFTTSVYQIRSTASGELPTDEDILRVIDEGMPGTTMPGWEAILSRQERLALVDYVKSFSPFFESSSSPEPLDFGDAPASSEERLEEGAEVYERIECYRCHGDVGRGDGASAPTLEDDQDRIIRARDLTTPWLFNGGSTVEEIYRRMRTGIDGTPMPSQSDLIQAEVITDDELWSLAHYVRSLGPDESPPPARDVIRAELLETGVLPTSVDDERWENVPSFYVPLVGQIIIEQRWFEPRVNAVWVQGLHDGQDLALRLTWNDPSESPDSAWDEWKTRMLDAVEPTASQEIEPAPWPDRISVQFPIAMPEGNELPYFLMGDGANPVYLWSWSSGTEAGEAGAREMEARGMTNQSEHGDETQNLTADATWEDGQWRVLIRRPLAADGEADELDIP
ncbi:MAG: c-type cytochrome, partial [Longimicrobiales bacterium]